MGAGKIFLTLLLALLLTMEAPFYSVNDQMEKVRIKKGSFDV